ncbi:hypothetical protein TUM12370_14050 [Salmonella enterica subsp. enterica serovar Choleraesuis]|nr:hypothetical protein TUM12370_14050 [Salmonella enterica subsp. enterica serovar Choleraesuis]
MTTSEHSHQIAALDTLLKAVLANITLEQKTMVVNYIRNDMDHVNITHEARLRAIEIMERTGD